MTTSPLDVQLAEHTMHAKPGRAEHGIVLTGRTTAGQDVTIHIPLDDARHLPVQARSAYIEQNLAETYDRGPA